jgi:hypothetical protein
MPCTSTLAVDVAWRAEALALFVVGPEGKCEGCLPHALDAKDCGHRPPGALER